MTKQKKDKILKHLKDVPNDELEDMYYKSVMETLGSDAEIMYERGYDITDIKEQERHEKYMCDYSDVLEEECLRRKIELWREKEND